jgi:long-chain acyl-CoA synthetase
MSNLAEALSKSAAANPDSLAIKLDDTELSYAQLDGASSLFAGHLVAQGIGPGDRVGMMIPNVPYFPVIYYGILKAGGVVVPMNVLLKGREVEFYLKDPDAKACYAWADFGEDAAIGAEGTDAELTLVKPGDFDALLGAATAIDQIVDRADDDTAVILYTSGTTGTPKGAELTHSNLISNRDTVLSMFEFENADVIFGGLPLFHSFGQTCCMNAGLAAGAAFTLLPRFDPSKAFDIIERDKVTVFMGVPTMYVALLNDPKAQATDTSSLRIAVSGGASLPVEVLHATEKLIGGKLLEGYGLSETSPVSSFNQVEVGQKPGSIGTPVPGVSMKLVDDDGNDSAPGEVGEIAIQGPNIMKGYWKRPDATAEVTKNGWFLSGDMAKKDDDGFYFIVDRKKELIIRGGYNVYPREIEEVVYEHPAVMEVAIIAVPDDSLGEEVACVVAFKPGEIATTEEIQSFVKERVAAYKYPRHVWIVEELPKTATGKILKREIEIPAEVTS